jgi:hypothetical protein
VGLRADCEHVGELVLGALGGELGLLPLALFAFFAPHTSSIFASLLAIPLVSLLAMPHLSFLKSGLWMLVLRTSWAGGNERVLLVCCVLRMLLGAVCCSVGCWVGYADLLALGGVKSTGVRRPFSITSSMCMSCTPGASSFANFFCRSSGLILKST